MIESLQNFKASEFESPRIPIDLEKSPAVWEKQLSENMRLLEEAVLKDDAEAVELIHKSIEEYSFAADEFEKSITDINILLGNPDLSRISKAVLENNKIHLERILMNMEDYLSTYREMLSHQVEEESKVLH